MGSTGWESNQGEPPPICYIKLKYLVVVSSRVEEVVEVVHLAHLKADAVIDHLPLPPGEVKILEKSIRELSVRRGPRAMCIRPLTHHDRGGLY